MSKEPTPRRRARLQEVLAHRQPDLTLVLANIHDPHNVSAIYRSCDAFGVDKVHLYYTDTPFPVLGRKTSASARKWVESVRHRDREELFAALRAQNMQVLATPFTPTARPLPLGMGTSDRGTPDRPVSPASMFELPRRRFSVPYPPRFHDWFMTVS